MKLLRLAVITAAAAMAQQAGAQEDNAQICMFRCAPQLGAEGYDQCLSDCFGEAEGEQAGGGAGADIAPLFGFWQADHTPCGTISDDSWQIDATGASPYESFCELRSASRDGDLFTLDQQCTFFEDEVEQMTTTVRLAGDGIEINGTRYARCQP